MTEQQLTEQINRLAHAIEPPAVAPADDLDRGRRRLRRRRWVAVAGSALAVGAVAVTAAVLPAASPDPDSRVATAPSASPSSIPSSTPSSTPSSSPAARRAQAYLRSMNDFTDAIHTVLVEHLDPDREHLAKAERTRRVPWAGTKGPTREAMMTFPQTGSLATSVGWTNAGEAGLGVIRAGVASGWGAARSWLGYGFPGAERRESTTDDGAKVVIGTYDGGTTYAVEHPDGLVGFVRTQDVWTNNSSVGVSGIELTEDALIAAAADGELDWPEPW